MALGYSVLNPRRHRNRKLLPANHIFIHDYLEPFYGTRCNLSKPQLIIVHVHSTLRSLGNNTVRFKQSLQPSSLFKSIGWPLCRWEFLQWGMILWFSMSSCEWLGTLGMWLRAMRSWSYEVGIDIVCMIMGDKKLFICGRHWYCLYNYRW